MTTPVPDIAYDVMHFTYDRLDRILPVAQTKQSGELNFTLLAIESYEAGFVATFLTEQEWCMPDPLPNPDEMVEPQILRGLLLYSDVVDDLGNRYESQMRAGSGGGGDDGRIRIHHVTCFAPHLHPEASALTLTVTQVERPDYDAEGCATWSDEQIIAGPVTLSISVDAAAAGDAPVAILPVAQQLTIDDVSVTVTTLERYSWGFVVNSRLDWEGPEGQFPGPTWRASDDLGGSYGTGNCGGGGGRDGDDLNSWRMHCIFQPKLAADASELHVRLTSLGMRLPVRSEEEDQFDHWELKREMANLGEIRVALPALGHTPT